MPPPLLTEKLLAGLAGWEVLKQARVIVAEDRVLSSSWEPPTLRGVVQSGETTFRAGLVIRRENDAENLCTCRQSREWGTLCSHSIAVGLHALKPALPSGSASPAARPTGIPGPAARREAPPLPPPRKLLRATAGEAADPVEIRVLFPPNLAEALLRGRTTVYFEARTGKGVVTLGSLAESGPYHLGEADARLLDAAELLALGDTPSMLQLAPADFATLLEALIDHPAVTFGKAQRASILNDPWRPPVRARLETSGEILLELRPLPRPPTPIAGARLWVLHSAEFRPVALPKALLPVLGGTLRLPRRDVPGFLITTLPSLRTTSDLEMDFAESDFELTPQAPRFLLHLAGGLAALTAQLHCRYGSRIVTPGVGTTGQVEWMPDPQAPRRYSTRDLAAERAALSRLARAGFTGPDAQATHHLRGQNPVLTFLAREFPRMQRDWEVTLEERLEQGTLQKLERVEPRFTVIPSGEQWFDLQVAYASAGGQRLPGAEVQRLLRGGQSHTRLANGKLALIDTGAVEELEQILIDASPEQRGGAYRLHQAQAGFLSASFQHQGWDAVAPTAWRERARLQSGEASPECPPLGPLDSILRPYQKQGVAWLLFLRNHGFGGLLADEMGLGKTLQTLALLAHTRSGPAAGPRAPHLVICPTSLVANWAAEAARFTPSLRLTVLHGPEREGRFRALPDSDLVITSYALIRRDLDRYRGLEFDTAILDEAQHIKNRQTQNAQAVKAIRARHRLVLTGTPLENSVLDLWSIFDFLMPGYLGTSQDFRDRYEFPIVRDRSEAVQQRLARRVRPFLLRRLKRDVAPELPARIDQVVWCELTSRQAAVYADLLNATRREVDAAGGPQGLPRRRMLVLTALLRLRQACCDLRLLGLEEDAPTSAEGGDDDLAPQPPGESPSPAPAASLVAPPKGTHHRPSGKLEAFDELLEEVLDGGHRVLVFSQFTSFLGLLRERLDATEVRYCYLDGSTRDRAGEIARFQQGSDIPVFLISLKAGGVGLNLTAADTVVHLDPWWNPAVEDQATDRAHRIGQQRVVTSYKLLTRGTVEEKILSLQQRKREVTGGLLADETQFAASITWEEIQDLLS